MPKFISSESKLSLYRGTYLDDQVNQLEDHNMADEEEDDLRDILKDLINFEKTGEPISNELVKIVNNVLVNPINSEKTY